MNCPNSQTWDLLAIEALDAPASEELLAHAQNCAACREQLAAARRLHVQRARLYEAFDRDHDRMREQLLAALPAGRPAGRAPGGLRRLGDWIMSVNNKVTRRTAAVLVPAACIAIVLMMFHSEKSAFAAAMERIREAHTISCRLQSFMNDADTTMQSGSLKVSDEHGARFDAEMSAGAMGGLPGGFGMTMFVKEGEPLVLIQPALKLALKLHVPPGFSGLQGNLAQTSPDAFLRSFQKMTGDADKTLGQQTIDGVLCEGFEISGRKLGLGPVAGKKSPGPEMPAVARIWISAKGHLPVRMEMEFTQEMPLVGSMKIRAVHDQFVFDAPLDPEIFVPNIPVGLRVLEVDVPMPSEETLIHMLQLAAQYAGHYPTALDPARISAELMVSLAMGGRVKVDPNDPASAFSRETMEVALNAAMGAAYIIQLNREDRELEYFGDSVTPEDGDEVLLRWKQDDGTYRVIYGDLHAETLPAQP